MAQKIPVGVLGATGAVGQRFIQLLECHPWFEVTALAASERSEGKRYAEACHWLLSTPMPESVRDMAVQETAPGLDCRVIFASLPGGIAGPTEKAFAEAGYFVCSNASAHRMDADVPLLVPEINAGHAALIDVQRCRRGWKGLIATSANCSVTAMILPLKPLNDAFGIHKLFAATMQAVSGAGYPGVPSLDILGNVVPYIGGEEEKMESEPRKMLGVLRGEAIEHAPFVASAQCNRVPVRDGHTVCLSIEFARKPESAEAVVEVLENFKAAPEIAQLPSTPKHPIVVRREPDRPQPFRDLDLEGGMAAVVGRVRSCPLFDYKFVVLGHNTVRGAAGGSIHNAEMLVLQGYIA
ncbi:MAG: aspartate-semialdehyde dehydrogenase [Anaerolineae bacterium]|nr:aspartate-semialdehyde dehydrogenase [Anaerolineae bacterium]